MIVYKLLSIVNIEKFGHHVLNLGYGMSVHVGKYLSAHFISILRLF